MSVAEVLVLAAALNVSPIELMCPVGFDKQAEILPGRMVDPLEAMRWSTGELKLELTETDTKLHHPTGIEEQSSTYLVEYHDELINKLRTQEDEAYRAAEDAARNGEDENAQREARYRMNALEEWRVFSLSHCAGPARICASAACCCQIFRTTSNLARVMRDGFPAEE